MKSFIKTLYSLLPFKKELFTLFKHFYSPPERIMKHLHFQGSNFTVNVRGGKDFLMFGNGTVLENQVFWRGVPDGWEPKSMTAWMFLLKNSKVIFDVGANTGLFSLTAKAQNPNSDVYSFEPIPKVFKQLTNNITNNGVNIDANQKAISNYSGKGFFFDDLDDHLLSVTLNQEASFYNDAKKRNKVETEVLRLDSFMDQNEIETIDLVKIDAEYHDAEVLEGLGKYLESSRPDILIEVLTDSVSKKINSQIDGLGYKIILVDEKSGFTSTSKVRKSPDFNALLLKERSFKRFSEKFDISEEN
jgi:FkbM family methyltransferase